MLSAKGFKGWGQRSCSGRLSADLHLALDHSGVRNGCAADGDQTYHRKNEHLDVVETSCWDGSLSRSKFQTSEASEGDIGGKIA